MSGLIPEKVPASLRIITYGTERMDQPTLDQLCQLLPDVDFRQTLGMSELGIVRVKSEARDSLFMKVGGEGVETRTVDGVLQIRSANRMLGYLNAILSLTKMVGMTPRMWWNKRANFIRWLEEPAKSSMRVD